MISAVAASIDGDVCKKCTFERHGSVRPRPAMAIIDPARSDACGVSRHQFGWLEVLGGLALVKIQ